MTKMFQTALFSLLTVLVTSVKAAPPTDTLNIGIGAEFENLNPLIGSQAATNYMLYLAWRPLVTLSLDGSKWQPNLIKQIPTLENKQAKRKGENFEINFELIDSAEWGDGTPVTCQDIEFSWKVGLSKNVSVGDHEPYENVKSVTWDKANPKKCTVVFNKTKFDYFISIPNPLPSHLEAPIFEKFKNESEGYDRNSLYTKNPTNPGLYNGPFVITDVKLGSHLIFSENTKYKGKKPHFKRIIFKLIPNTGVLTSNLRAGNIDMISTAAGISIDQALAFEKSIKAENLPFEVRYQDGLVYAHIDLNMANPILADHKVRQALAYGFNKEEMLQSLMQGKGKPAVGFVGDLDPWFPKGEKGFKFDRKEANRLLDEAGWKMGSKGVREKGGKTLTLTLMSAAGAKLNEMIQTYLQSQYKAIGVQILLKNEPARVFFGTTLQHRSYDMAMYSWVSIPESSPRSTLHSNSIPSDANSWSGQNTCGYKNPEVDKLIDQLEMELNPKKRAQIGAKIMKKYIQDVPVIPVYYRPNDAVIPKGMKNFGVAGHQFYETLYAEDWQM